MSDPPCYVFGAQECPRHDVHLPPLRDPAFTDSQRKDAFVLWIGGYFDHKLQDQDFSSVSYSDFASSLVHTYGNTDPTPPTTERMSPEQRASLCDITAGFRAHLPSLFLDHTDSFRRAFFNTDIWPDLRLEYICCSMSIPDCLYSIWYLSQQLKEEPKHRKVTTHMLRANRCVSVHSSMSISPTQPPASIQPHWDEPEMFAAYIAKLI